MKTKTMYLVIEEDGSYEDRRETPVRVVSSEERAKALCCRLEALNARALEINKVAFQTAQDWKAANPLPPAPERPVFDQTRAMDPGYQKGHEAAVGAWRAASAAYGRDVLTPYERTAQAVGQDASAQAGFDNGGFGPFIGITDATYQYRTVEVEAE